MAKYKFNIDYILSNVIDYFVHRYEVIEGVPSEQYFDGAFGRLLAAGLAVEMIARQGHCGKDDLDEEDIAAILFVQKWAANEATRLARETGMLVMPVSVRHQYDSIHCCGIKRKKAVVK